MTKTIFGVRTCFLLSQVTYFRVTNYPSPPQVLCSIKLKDDPNPKVSPFRKALLNRCQKEFCREKDVEEEMDKKIHDLKHNST